MTQTYEHVPNVTGVAAARRLLGLDAAAGPDEVEAAAAAVCAAIRVPDESPDLVRTAAHLHQRVEHARSVLLATMPPGPPSPTPPPPAPPPPPVVAAPGVMPRPPSPGTDRAARTREARQKRSAHTRAGVHAVALVVALLLLGATAFAITRALSRSVPPDHTTTTTTAVTATPQTTVAVRTFADLLVSGELGRSADGLAAGSANEALAAWLDGYQQADPAVVARGIDDESRLVELAEIGSRSVPADRDRINCSAFGKATWRCKVGAVTSATKRVEVSRTASGWRVRGWYTT